MYGNNVIQVKVNELPEEAKLKILRKVVEEKRIDYEKLGVTRVQAWRYTMGRQKIHDYVVENAIKYLSPEEVSEIVYGFSLDNVTFNDAIKVVAKAVQSPEFREFLLSSLHKHLGEFVNRVSNMHVVTGDDQQLFQKVTQRQE
ncbi:hypothetical protein HS1genome_1273 [Sulfodiicoccus acidiphilus]|uniref:Uncharacterized protein n=1 Tax=Sulfodiicoccus acidiphilus TaxID=1670455 RepID=A0A348B3Y2_9CREN|nr:hypothetical protein [Sulfodiicoccus acidiphilus]BBD72884.1 hypothetical protein HS1genome_1273 [Sulfodiicoccus acidiphilus]GGT88252.1 hypothetical protein GCM10007116_02790 [Sulfodiicoccus acidiphilus]